MTEEGCNTVEVSEQLISVLVATRNRPEKLRRCLSSIRKQVIAPGWQVEVLVLDDAPDVSAREVVEGISGELPVRYLVSQKRLGVSAARNCLAKAARGMIAVVLDDDAEFVDDRALLHVIDTMRRLPNVGVIAFYIEDEATGRLHVPFPRWVLRTRPDILRDRVYVSYFNGGGYAVRLSAFRQVGEYDDSLMYSCEELDLAFRIIEGGWVIVFDPQVKIRHFPGQASFARGDKAYYSLRNHLWIARRYLPMPYRVAYIAVWTAFEGWNLIVRLRSVQLFVKALWDGLTVPQKRCLLSRESKGYCLRNFGRLWW